MQLPTKTPTQQQAQGVLAYTVFLPAFDHCGLRGAGVWDRLTVEPGWRGKPQEARRGQAKLSRELAN